MWDRMDSKELETEGYFYSCLAEFLFKNPGKSALVGKHNIKEIAASWKLGMPITVEMVEDPSPLPDGEGLILEDRNDQPEGSESGTPKGTPTKGTPRGTPKKLRSKQPSLMAAKVKRDGEKKMY